MTGQQNRFSWGHININVSNLDHSIAFYQKLGFRVFLPAIPYLGLNSGPELQAVPEAAAAALGLPSGLQGRACIMQLDDGFPKIDLTELAGTSQQGPLVNADLGLARICLASQDLKKDYLYLREQGVQFLCEPQVCKDGMAEIASCLDPDGTCIELIQVYLEKWTLPV